MARRNDDDERWRRQISRRDLTKLVGATALSLPVVGAGTAAAADYETVTVPAGETVRYTLGSGETLENKLIDISAQGADVEIRASGDNWTIRNVGVRGTTDQGRPDSDAQWAMLWVDGNGTIENVYLGDGVQDYVRRTGIATNAREHTGHVDIRNAHVAGWSDNGMYVAHNANYGGGTVRVEDSYFHDNNVSSIRMAVDGDVAENVTVHNTGNVPPLPSGAVYSRGVFTYYGDPSQTVTVRNCDVDVRPGNTNGTAYAFAAHSSGGAGTESTTVSVENTEYRGDTIGPSLSFGAGNGNNPDTNPPAGVPTTAEEAASGGTQSGDGSSGEQQRTITIDDRSSRWKVNYELSVSGSLEKSTANGATVDDHDVIDGSTTAGHVWGGTDSYQFTGDITEFWVDAPVTVTVDGQAVDPADLGSDLSNTVTIVSDTEQVNYELSVSGDLEKSVDNDATVDDGDVIEGSTATGRVWGWKDSYRFSGEVTGLSTDGDATVYLDGEQVDPSTL